MRRINKLVAIILCLSMAFSGCILATADSTPASQTFAQEYYDAVEMFGGMGIWTKDMAPKSADELISRAQFADILAKVTALDVAGYDGASYFVDVAKDSTGYDAINQLAKAGVISGNTDGTFCPDDNITLYQASKLIVCALGYSFKAELNGGYSVGYLTVADRLDITDGFVGGDDCITKQNALIMMYRALFVGVNDIVAIKNGEAEYLVSDDETILSQRFDIYKTEGKITENAYTSLIGDTSLGANEVKINGIVLNAGTTNAQDLLGYEVTAYYKSTKGSAVKTIVQITDQDTNDVIRINADDIISFKDSTYTYSVGNNKQKEAKVRVDADIIYNGKALKYDTSYLVPKEGYVELVRNGSSGGYSTVLISDIKNLVVNTINMDSEIVTGKYGVMPVDFGDDGGRRTVVIKDTDGKDVLLEDIFMWDVISYTESQDKRLLRATVVRDYITGKVTGTSSDELHKIEIEENEFDLSTLYPNQGQYKINAGDKGDFLLDITGKIAAFVKSESGQMVYGYLVGAGKATGALNKNTVLKVFCADRGVMKIFDTTDSVRLDGTSVKSTSDTLKNLADRVIRYKLNAKGEICEIDTSDLGTNENAESSMFISAPMSSAALYFKRGSISGRTLISGQTVVFIVPEDRDDDEKYKIKSLAYFKDNYTYQAEAYNSEKEYSYADAILMYSSLGDGSDITQNTYMAMVERITRTSDDDGLPCYKLYYGINGRTESAIICDEVKIYNSSATIKATELTPGTVIRIGTDFKSRINEVDLLYLANSTHDGGEFKGNSAVPTTGFNDTTRILFGYVYLTKDDTIKITAKHPSEMTAFDGDNTEGRILSNFKCMMLDTTKKDPYVRTAYSDDFMDYIHYGDKCSKVLVQTKNGDTYTIMIVK